MRQPFAIAARLAAVAGAALFVTGCGGDDEAANQAGADAPNANMMMEAPANDASALEAAANAAQPSAPDVNGSQGTDAPGVLGNRSGGNGGGNAAESNVSGR